jgi:hypothetical protein
MATSHCEGKKANYQYSEPGTREEVWVYNKLNILRKEEIKKKKKKTS